jgi:hypothetical protein
MIVTVYLFIIMINWCESWMMCEDGYYCLLVIYSFDHFLLLVIAIEVPFSWSSIFMIIMWVCLYSGFEDPKRKLNFVSIREDCTILAALEQVKPARRYFLCSLTSYLSLHVLIYLFVCLFHCFILVYFFVLNFNY